MGLTVFDSDVLIGFLDDRDAHHIAAVEQVRSSLPPEEQRWLSAVTLSEILVKPLQMGTDSIVADMIARLRIDVRVVDQAAAIQAAAVRAQTNLKLPDAHVLATAIQADASGHRDVSIATFDKRILQAHAKLSTG